MFESMGKQKWLIGGDGGVDGVVGLEEEDRWMDGLVGWLVGWMNG